MSGTVAFGSSVGDVLLVGGASYVVISRGTFTAMHRTLHLPLSACATVCGKYLRLPDGTFSAITLPAMNSQLEASFPAAASVTTVRLVTYQGQPAYELTNPQGQVLYAAKRAPHYALAIVNPSGPSVDFSEWNAVPPVKAPPPSQVFHR